jgi:predicted DNA-binding transcriptional regulator AlpA
MTKVWVDDRRIAFKYGFVVSSVKVPPMYRKRPDMDKMRSSQVAKILGVAPKTLYRMLRDGRIPEPARSDVNNYREWTREEVQALVKELGSRC